MYVYKICVLKIARFCNANNKDMSVIKRINYVLNKIIILALCYESFGSIFLICTLYGGLRKDGSIWLIFQELLYMMESVLNALMIYLMIEHNDEQYLEVLRILNKCKLCYCFDAGEEENENSVDHGVEPLKNPTVDTKTIYPDHTLPMEHKIHQTDVSSNVFEE